MTISKYNQPKEIKMNIQEFEFEDMGRCSVAYADQFGQCCSVDLTVMAKVSEVKQSNGVGHEYTEYEIEIEGCHAWFMGQDGDSISDDDYFDEYTEEELKELVLSELKRSA